MKKMIDEVYGDGSFDKAVGSKIVSLLSKIRREHEQMVSTMNKIETIDRQVITGENESGRPQIRSFLDVDANGKKTPQTP